MFVILLIFGMSVCYISFYFSVLIFFNLKGGMPGLPPAGVDVPNRVSQSSIKNFNVKCNFLLELQLNFLHQHFHFCLDVRNYTS
jgi:hypothetical protein